MKDKAFTQLIHEVSQSGLGYARGITMKKNTIGIFKAMRLCTQYQKMSEEERTTLRETRLRFMVKWAKENSPYYAQLYKNIEADSPLPFLPPVNKLDLMSHWDEWVTDKSLRLSQVNEFMTDTDNIGRKFKDKYLVFTTSGSTGNPLVSLCDGTTNNVCGAINAVRSFARKKDMSSFIKRGGKTIGIFATGGFYLAYSSVRSRLLKMPWKKRQIAVTSALLPIHKIVEELNAFQPAMLGGYPSNLELLIEKQQSGQLHISPVLIMTGGEYLSDALREKLAKAFCCYVQTSYACTEGGTIACECTEQHFHINDDWIILEVVDQSNCPVPDGVQGDKILLTNLFNFSQPFIRYEVTDRVVKHNEPCKCGNPSPWLTLEGRTDDVVSFTQNGVTIKLAPLAIYATLKEVQALQRFQLLTHPDRYVELRLEPAKGYTTQEAFTNAKSVLERFFLLHGLTNIDVILSHEKPRQEAGSGKFKHIIRKE